MEVGMTLNVKQAMGWTWTVPESFLSSGARHRRTNSVQLQPTFVGFMRAPSWSDMFYKTAKGASTAQQHANKQPSTRLHPCHQLLHQKRISVIL